jgi:hypothetical protein
VSRRPGDPLGDCPPFFMLLDGLIVDDWALVSWSFLAAAEGEASDMFNLFRIVKITNIYIFLL